MYHTKLFTSARPMGGLFGYQEFLKNNQRIKIVSVNIMRHDKILLTYQII